MDVGREHPWDVHGTGREHRMQCMLGRANTATCSISLDRISESDVPGLPQRWRVNDREYDSMRMPCGHLFHTSTLMMHFLTNDMRCPVCRQGAAVKASLDCVPESAAAAFASKLAEMDEREQELQVHEIGLYTTRETLEDGLRLAVEVHTTLDVTVMSSRLVCEAASPDDGVENVFRAQHSFYRRLEQHLHDMGAQLPTSVLLVFRLTHVLLEESICSDPLSLDVYRRICIQQHYTRELRRQSQLRFMNVLCGGLLPSRGGPCTAFSLSLNREYVHLVLLSRLQMYLAEYGAQ
jgi:hypothetical protein